VIRRGEYERGERTPRSVDRRALKFPDKTDPADTADGRRVRDDADRRARGFVEGVERDDRTAADRRDAQREERSRTAAKAKGPRDPQTFCREVLDKILNPQPKR
jgi:hypothetical protein